MMDPDTQNLKTETPVNSLWKKRKVYLETYGCQMNEYDSELVRGILRKEGCTFVKDELQADIIMLNTCAIREHAHRKIYGRVHDIRHKRNGNPAVIGILGCMATNLRQELLENRNLNIDFIAGPDSYKRLPALIRECSRTGDKQFDLTLSEFETYSDVYPERGGGVNPSTRPADSLRVNAWIAVMRGCNNFCTFCVVPYTRGRERSRAVENVLEETRRLAGEGFKQVTLLGQNVNSYRHGEKDFADLLEAVSRVEGIERIRFTSPHPKDFPERLLKIIAENPKVCNQIHLPLQAGNNRVLEAMNRTYTKEDFLKLVETTRRFCPGIALSTDIIAGFPTETDEEFEDTVRVMEEVGFDSAFLFKYSERKGTIASRKLPDDVPEEKKTERIVRLNDLQKKISLEKNRVHIGMTFEILIEKIATFKGARQAAGRTDGNKLVHVPAGSFAPGQTIRALITSVTPNVLVGTPV